jgi:hypothetical protein
LFWNTTDDWLIVAPDGRIDAASADSVRDLMSWTSGPFNLLGDVAWPRQHTPGLLRELVTGARHAL